MLVLQRDGLDKEFVYGPGQGISCKVRKRLFSNRGKIEAIHDSSIVLKGKEIFLKDIKWLEARRKEYETAGWVVMGVGTGLSIGAIVAILMIDDQAPRNPVGPNTFETRMSITMLSYMAVLTVGVIIHAFGRKRFDFRNRWKMRIERR